MLEGKMVALGDPGPSKGLTKEARLVSILETFERGVGGVRGSAIADREGLPIANGFREPFDVVAVAAMSTLTAQSSKTVFSHLNFKPPRAVIIEGEDAKVIVYQLGNGAATFIALVRPDTNIGLLKLEMAATARRLEEELGFLLPQGITVEEVFLLTPGGLMISHASRDAKHVMDRDIVAGMFTAVQEFVKDTFREKGGGALEDMELAHLRVRLLRARWSSVAIVSTGRLSERYEAVVRAALEAFENENRAGLADWDGDTENLRGVDQLLDEVLNEPPT